MEWITLAPLVFVTPLIARFAAVLDSRFLNSDWFITTALVSLAGATAAQFVIWMKLEQPTWIKIALSLLCVVLAITSFFLIVILSSKYGWQGVPSEPG